MIWRKLFLGVCFLPILVIAQAVADSNKLLREEYFKYKKSVEELYEQASRFDANIKEYKREIDSLSKSLRLRELQNERMILMRYRDTIECSKTIEIRSIFPFDNVLLQDCDEVPKKEIDFFFYLRPSLKLYNLKLDSVPNVQDNLKLMEVIKVAQDRIEHNQWLIANFSDIERRYSDLKQKIPELSFRIDETTLRVKSFNQQLADTLAIWRKECQLKPEQCKMCKYDEQKAYIPKEDIVYGPIEEPAEFIGNLKEYIAANLVYPERAKKEGIEGKCYLQFTIDTVGNVSNVQLKKGLPDCPECDQEALRMVQNMPPWKPGRVGGKLVNSKFNLPVKFTLPKE